MTRRFFFLAATCVVLLALFSGGTAFAQDDDADGGEEAAEPARYGDAELIETLRGYGLLDDWVAASPVSPRASLLDVTSGSYRAQRDAFLRSLNTWAQRTELVRSDLARLDAADAHTQLVRTAVVAVRDALVLDDRLRGPDSETLVTIETALAQLETFDIPEREAPLSDNPIASAEMRLRAIRERAETELAALNGSEPAVTRSGVDAFVGFDGLQRDLREVELLIARGRELVRPAQLRSERLAASAIGQIPDLHGARMLGATDVDGLSVVTVDAYIRGAASVPCAVDWALLAGIGKIESNHGRLGGASVSRTGQVSTTIFGPLLDGGATERAIAEEADAVSEPTRGTREGATAAQSAVRPDLLDSWWISLRDRHDPEAAADETDEGNGFAVIVDSDDGRLDGNDEWDRAIGPMQFLPETWTRWATDGNGDGFADPHNLYDAAASAARFLCHLSETRSSSPSTYLLGYNDSRSYVRSVLSTADRLRATLLPAV